MQKQFIYPIIFALLAALSACIGDDIIDDRVDEQIRILSNVDTIGFGEEFQFEASFFNNVGAETETLIEWSSSDEVIITIDQTGLAKAISAGAANIYATVDLMEKSIRDTIPVVVGENTVVSIESRSGTIKASSFYTLEGSFTMTEEDGTVTIAFADDYVASEALPGLYIYLTNNPNTVGGALEIGAVDVFKGEHNYKIEELDINEYNHLLYWCKPFGVKVGDGDIE
ncbi:MAG: Ig-like domain-containing protein [Bacteroidota bacterium]